MGKLAPGAIVLYFVTVLSCVEKRKKWQNTLMECSLSLLITMKLTFADDVCVHVVLRHLS